MTFDLDNKIIKFNYIKCFLSFKIGYFGVNIKLKFILLPS